TGTSPCSRGRACPGRCSGSASSSRGSPPCCGRGSRRGGGGRPRGWGSSPSSSATSSPPTSTAPSTSTSRGPWAGSGSGPCGASASRRPTSTRATRPSSTGSSTRARPRRRPRAGSRGTGPPPSQMRRPRLGPSHPRSPGSNKPGRRKRRGSRCRGNGRQGGRGAARAPGSATTTRLNVRVLLVHNHYQQPGGEDQVFREEGALLERFGHTVFRYVLHNDDVEGIGRAALAARTLWSRPAYRDVERIVRAEGIEVVHVHNTLPLASPAVYWAARKAGAAVVQTLHNFRLLCPGATLFRDGRPCTECLGRLPLPAVRHACYRGSRSATAAVAAMLTAHCALGTWRRAVDRYIALTPFARDLFVRGGLPAA